MKKIGLFLVICCVVGRTEASSAWSGLWMIAQDTSSGIQTLHLHVGDEQTGSKLYGEDWKEEPLAEAKVGQDNLYLNWQANSFNIVFDGQRTADRVEGQWKGLHPQYRIGGTFVAQRLFPNPRWTPEGALLQLSSGSGFADVTGLLLNKVDEGQADFLDFWKTGFVPDYFAFWEGTPSAEVVFASLSDPDVARQARQFSESFGRLSKRVTENLQDVEFNLLLVSLPYGDAAAVNRGVHGARFVLVNPVEFVKREDPREYEIEMAHQLFKSFLVGTLQLSRRLSSRFFHDGVAYYLTSRLGYSDDPADFLQLSEQELAGFQSDSPQYLKRIAEEDPSLPPAAWKYFSYDFVKRLIGERNPASLPGFSPPLVEAAFQQYIESTSTESGSQE